MFKPCDVLERLGHLDGIVPSTGLACILTKEHGIRGGKYLLNTPENAISKTLIFKMCLDALALKNLYLWCEFQSCLPFIIGLILKNFLKALTRQSSNFNFPFVILNHLLQLYIYGGILSTIIQRSTLCNFQLGPSSLVVIT